VKTKIGQNYLSTSKYITKDKKRDQYSAANIFRKLFPLRYEKKCREIHLLILLLFNVCTLLYVVVAIMSLKEHLLGSSYVNYMTLISQSGV